MSLLDQLTAVERQYRELEAQLGDPDVVNNPNRLKDVAKRFRDLSDLYRAYEQYRERLAKDHDNVASVRRAEESGCILVEDRAFLERV